MSSVTKYLNMKQKTKWLFIFMMLLLCIVPETWAQGLLGRRYIGLLIGFEKTSDDSVKEIDDSIFHLGAMVNVPLNSNIDLNFSIQHDELDGDTQETDIEATGNSFILGLNYHFLPANKTNPFIGGNIGILNINTEIGGLSDDDDDFIYSILLGIETDLSSKAALRPIIEYEKAEEYDDFIVNLDLNYWFTDNFFGGVGFSYGIDEEDFVYDAFIGASF